MSIINDITRSLFSPHGRAERLIDAQLDAARGEGSLSERDERWLERHIESCVDCRATREERRALLDVLANDRVEAPQGFAGRVLMAAKARGREPVEELPVNDEPVLGRRYALGGLVAVAMGLGLFVFAAQNQSPVRGNGSLHVSGTGTEMVEKPHFSVRATGVRAAQARAQIAEIAQAHGGRLESSGNAVIVHIPRSALLAVVQDLAKRGRYKVSRADAGSIEPDVETIIMRFEVD
jgi:hypothetical protein